MSRIDGILVHGNSNGDKELAGYVATLRSQLDAIRFNAKLQDVGVEDMARRMGHAHVVDTLGLELSGDAEASTQKPPEGAPGMPMDALQRVYRKYIDGARSEGERSEAMKRLTHDVLEKAHYYDKAPQEIIREARCEQFYPANLDAIEFMPLSEREVAAIDAIKPTPAKPKSSGPSMG